MLTIAGITLIALSGACVFLCWRCQKIKRRCEKLEKELAEQSEKADKSSQSFKTIQTKLFDMGRISALASLSAGILHQISQPLTAMHGLIRFMKKEMAPKDNFYKPVCLMDEQAVYLKTMIDDLMNLIRHKEIKKEEIDVNAVLKRAMNLLTDELRIKRIYWDVILADSLPLVLVDSIHLQQIFMNIAINSIQALGAMPQGAGRMIKVTTEFHKVSDEVVIVFQDNGPGMSAETRQAVFQPFFSTKEEGAGIGLAVCKDLIEEFQGRIDVDSTPEEEGARFIISLPAVKGSKK